MAYKCPLLVRLADNYRWYKKWSQCGRANTCTQLWLKKAKTKTEFRFYRSLWKNCNQIRHTLLLYGVHFVTSLWGLLLVSTNFCWKEQHVHRLCRVWAFFLKTTGSNQTDRERWQWTKAVTLQDRKPQLAGRQKRLIEQSRADNFFTHIRPAYFLVDCLSFPILYWTPKSCFMTQITCTI